jgi:hypothetical protein
MLEAWFSTKTDPDEAANIARLEEPVATPVDATPADAPEKTPSRPRAEERT